MDAKAALALAKECAAAGNVRLEEHAWDRMNQRGVAAVDDVVEAILTAQRAKVGNKPQRWVLLDGTDLDGDGLDVVVRFGGGNVVVVTVY